MRLPRLSLSAKIASIATMGLLLASAANLVSGNMAMSNNAHRQAVERQETNMRVAMNVLHQYGDTFHVSGGKLYLGDHVLNGEVGPVDKVKSLVGGTATIFMGDLRVATNIKKPDGSRATGTHLQPGPVYDAVLRDGRSYRGEAVILGAPYLVAYDPIKVATGETVGAVFVGVPKADFFAPIKAIELKSALLSGVLTLIIAAGVLWIARRLFDPLNGLRMAMSRIAQGDLKVEVPWAAHTDDIGAMAQVVVEFREGAIEKVQMEADAVAQREAAEQERRRTDALKIATAAALTDMVAALARGLDSLSQGDLTYRVTQTFGQEYKKLQDDFNAAVGKLQQTMTVISGNTAGIESGAQEISQASDDLARRTEQQAASLEETAAALDEITATVKRTAEGALHARQVVVSAKADAERSGEVVGQAVAAMGGIKSFSEQIGSIVGVIDEIAFQTNLLALNAGVEAARAGDAGRGFAVVASEVRALAQRSAAAAKEIKTLISASATQVAAGVGLVDETGKALQRIASQITEINGVVGEIAASAQEQATALHEVNTAVNQMDQVTQQNAAMVEEATAASHSLATEAQDLAQLVGQFQIGDRPGTAGGSRKGNAVHDAQAKIVAFAGRR